MTGAKAQNLCFFFIFRFFVISQENEVVGSPSKGQVSKAPNYWKHL